MQPPAHTKIRPQLRDERPRHPNARTRSLRAAIHALRAEPSPNEILKRVTTEARILVNADLAGVLLRAEPQRGWAMEAADPAEMEGLDGDVRVSAGEGSLLGQVLQSALPGWAMDLRKAAPAGSDWAVTAGMEALALLPIVCEGVIYCALAVAWRNAAGIPDGASALVEALAEHAGVALELAALKGELEMGGLRAELTARAEGAEALHRVAAEVAGRRDVQGIAEDAVQALLSLYDADAGAFYMIDETGLPRSIVYSGLSAGFVERVEAEYTGGQRRLFRDGRSQVIGDVLNERRVAPREMLLAEGIRTVARVPATSDGRIIGALVLYHRRPRGYWPHELALLEAFAVQLAGGLRLAQAYGQLQAADRQREEFLALISHELRHPVAAISTVAAVLADTPGLGALEKRALEGLRGQAQALTQLAEEVMSVARIETGMVKLRRTRIDLCVLVEGMVRQGTDPDRVTVESNECPLLVRADAELLGRAIDNLVRNALKYSTAPAPVLVKLSSDESSVCIDVIDQGVGLQARDIPQLFKKYGRVTNDRTAGIEGVGLGLYLTRMLVEAHGGTIHATSKGPNRGSTFTIRIPHG